MGPEELERGKIRRRLRYTVWRQRPQRLTFDEWKVPRRIDPAVDFAGGHEHHSRTRRDVPHGREQLDRAEQVHLVGELGALEALRLEGQRYQVIGAVGLRTLESRAQRRAVADVAELDGARRESLSVAAMKRGQRARLARGARDDVHAVEQEAGEVRACEPRDTGDEEPHASSS